MTAWVQAVVTQTYSGASSVAVTFGLSLTSGSTIIAWATQENGATGTFSVADNGNAGTYTQDAIGSTGASGGIGDGKAAVFSKANTATTAATVTCTLNTSTYGVFAAGEASGSLALNISGSGNNASSSPSVAITTTTANCLVAAAMVHYPSGGGADTGFTVAPADFNAFFAYSTGQYDEDVGAAGVKTLTFNGAPSANWAMAVAAYSAAPPVGGIGPIFRGS